MVPLSQTGMFRESNLLTRFYWQLQDVMIDKWNINTSAKLF